MNFPEPDYVEGTIYSGGFPSYRDKDLMQEFHACEDVEHLVKISRNFEDDRYRVLAERIICSNYDADIPSGAFVSSSVAATRRTYARRSNVTDFENVPHRRATRSPYATSFVVASRPYLPHSDSARMLRQSRNRSTVSANTCAGRYSSMRVVVVAGSGVAIAARDRFPRARMHS